MAETIDIVSLAADMRSWEMSMREGGRVAAAGLFRDVASLLESQAVEIERLRAGGCARDQTTTQFCAEAAKFAREAAAYRHIREAATGAEKLFWWARRNVRARFDLMPSFVQIDITVADTGHRIQRGIAWPEVESSVLNPLLMHMDDMLAQLGVDLPDGWSWIDGAPLPPAPHKGE